MTISKSLSLKKKFFVFLITHPLGSGSKLQSLFLSSPTNFSGDSHQLGIANFHGVRLLEIKIKSKNLPSILDDIGNKKFFRRVRVAENKAIGAARKVAANELRAFYGMKARGPKYGPPSPYAKPAINQVIETRLVRGIEGVKQGVPAKLLAETKRLSAVRFTASSPQPAKLKGVKVKDRKKLQLRIGKRKKKYKKLFVQKGNNSPRLHVYRSKDKGAKWVMHRETITPVFTVLSRTNPQSEMFSKASSAFEENFTSDLGK